MFYAARCRGVFPFGEVQQRVRVTRNFKDTYMPHMKRFVKDESGAGLMTGVEIVLGIIIMSALLFAGLLVDDGFYTSMALDANSTFYNASQSVVNATTSAYSMSGTMMTVMIAGGIITILLSAFGIGMLIRRAGTEG